MSQTGIAHYRSRKRLKAIELAEALGTNEARMSRIENGLEIPTAAELDKIVEVLEVPPTHLLSKHILAEIAERSRAGAA